MYYPSPHSKIRSALQNTTRQTLCFLFLAPEGRRLRARKRFHTS